MKTRIKEYMRVKEHMRVKENIIKPSEDIFTKVIFRTLIVLAIFPIIIVPPLIFLEKNSIFGAILILLLEIVCFPAIYFTAKKVQSYFQNIPYFKKSSVNVFNQRKQVPTLQIKNHHNYFPQKTIKKQYNLYKYRRDHSIIVIINISATFLSIINMIFQGFSIFQSIVWNLGFIIVATGLQLLLYNSYKKENNIQAIKYHYIVNMNPKYYHQKENTIFFY